MAKVEIDLETARLIRVYLPSNPNKLRKTAPELVQAVRDFLAALERAENGYPPRREE